MSVGPTIADVLVCYCYEVTETEIRRIIDTNEARTVEEVTVRTCAGSGCTACHCRIRRMLAGLPATCDTCADCGFLVELCACRAA